VHRRDNYTGNGRREVRRAGGRATKLPMTAAVLKKAKVDRRRRRRRRGIYGRMCDDGAHFPRLCSPALHAAERAFGTAHFVALTRAPYLAHLSARLMYPRPRWKRGERARPPRRFWTNARTRPSGIRPDAAQLANAGPERAARNERMHICSAVQRAAEKMHRTHGTANREPALA